MSFIRYKTPESFRSSFNPVLGFSEDVLNKVNAFIKNKITQEIVPDNGFSVPIVSVWEWFSLFSDK